MNYRHSYHAGNFADVFKHVILVELILALQHKPKAFCYLDTHAGAGYYDLATETAQKTREFESGISKLWQQQAVPDYLNHYWSLITTANQQQTQLRYYPGSPRMVRPLLRAEDRMVLTELHPEEAAELKREFRGDKQVAVHQLDGYQALKAFLPPSERRGLVFMDPPFEQTDEFDRIVAQVAMALTRWSSGIYAIWFPIKDRQRVTKFYQALANSSGKPVLLAEFAIFPEDSPVGLNACGMVIINPPWQIEAKLTVVLQTLWQILSPDKLGGSTVTWLVT